jgi:hypothetical protein
MINADGAPMNRAALTNSRSRRVSVIPRRIRAVIIQANIPSSSTNSTQLLPRSAGEITAMIRNDGSTSSRSTTHMRPRSTQPPK